MMNLPLNITQSFKRVPENPVATNLSLFDKLLENEKYLSMQFLFNVNVSWKVDLSVGSPFKPLAKISNLYIDAINSQHDALVYFPDTGYAVRVAAGTTFLAPSLVSRGSYIFYVSLVGQITNPTDIVNIFAMNVSVPFFDSLWQYTNGLSTSSPTIPPGGTNKSTWFYVNSNIVQADKNAVSVVLIGPTPGSPQTQTIFENDDEKQFLLKKINYDLILVGISPESSAPPPDGQLSQIKIDLVESNLFLPDIIINTQIFTNTQQGTASNANFFLSNSSLNYLVRDNNSYLSVTITILQGALFINFFPFIQSNMNINMILDYVD